MRPVSVWWVALLVAVFTAALHLPRLDRPIERSLASASTTYMVLFFRGWDQVGFRALRGLPTVGQSGTDPVSREAYLHHPVGVYWAIYLARRTFGWNEWAFRLVPFLGTVAGSALTVFFCAGLGSRRHAGLAGLLYPLLGLTFAFGLMPNTDPVVVPWLLGIFLAWRRDRSRRWPLLTGALLFVGTWLEWQITFAGPAIVLGEILRPRAERRLASALSLAIPGFLGVLSLLSYFCWAMGDVDFVRQHLETAVGHAFGLPEPGAAWFWAHQLATWRQYFGWPVLLLAAAAPLALVLVPRLALRQPGRELIAGSVPVVATLTLFTTPAADHDFFWMPVLVVLPSWFAVVLAWLERRASWALPILVLAVFGSGAWAIMQHEELTDSPHFRELGAMIASVTGSDDLVMTPEDEGPVNFYTRATVIGAIGGPDLVQFALDRRSRGQARFERLWVWMYPWSEPDHQPLVQWLDARAQRLDYAGVRAWVMNPAEQPPR